MLSYIDPLFKILLRDPRVEYRQSNLSNAERYPSLFEPPAEGTRWTRFDIVFDLTGEMSFDKPELVSPRKAVCQLVQQY